MWRTGCGQPWAGRENPDSGRPGNEDQAMNAKARRGILVAALALYWSDWRLSASGRRRWTAPWRGS